MQKLTITKENLYEAIQFFGSMRQSLVISAGMKAVENAVITGLEESGLFGKQVVNAGNKKHYLEVSDPSRKTGTYELDAMFETDDEIFLVDVKPSSHDNSTPAQQHANKFRNALDIYRKTTTKKVSFVFAIYGGITQEELNNSSYYQTMEKNEIKCISMTDLIGFDAEKVKQKLLFDDLERLVFSANKKNNNENMMNSILSLQE